MTRTGGVFWVGLGASGALSVAIHAFVLMDNHYHLLLRSREANLSEAIRWLQVGYAGRFNWRTGGGDTCSRDDSNPCCCWRSRPGRSGPTHSPESGACWRAWAFEAGSTAGTGVGLEDPGREMVARRVSLLREYPWSSWRMYAGREPSSSWLCRERLQGDAVEGHCGSNEGRSASLRRLRSGRVIWKVPGNDWWVA